MFGYRPSPSDQKALEEFEEQAENASQIQEQLLRTILEHNKSCEYLRRHDCTGVESFRSKVPVILHSDIARDVERIAYGDTSPILCTDPVEKFSLSSGTSAGKSKMIPVTKASTFMSTNIGRVSPVLRQRKYPVPEDSSVVLAFVFAAKRFKLKSGLMAGTATSNYFHSEEFTKRDTSQEELASPNEVILQGEDFRQVMYCHLLCGLIKRESVGVIMSFFAYMVVEALRMLESCWEELSEDIRRGTLRTESRVSDPVLRRAMSEMLQDSPDENLANFISDECKKGTGGIVGRLWPKLKFVMCVMTGSMAPYVDSLRHYSGDVPLVNSDYGASEAFPVGINMNPSDPPERVLFTLVPSSSYYEFLPVTKSQVPGAAPEVVNLKNVEVGESYEVVLTNFSGLYRYRLGDVIKIQGFYKSLPRFSFVRRVNVVLSINTDKTDEEELQLVVAKAGHLLKGDRGTSHQEIADFTSYGDVFSRPGHYIIFIELRGAADRDHGASTGLERNKLQECAEMMDSSFNNPYMRGRAAGTIGPLELRVVEQGTFSQLLDCAISQGASASQFKTPRCIANPKMLTILQKNTFATFHSTVVS